MADLEFELLDAFLDANYVLLERSLVVLELCDLLLESCSLSLLVRVVPLDLLFNAMKLISESLPRVLLLHGQD